ncbi:hypothetical protein CKO41_18275 [Thiococcus pfennigii]|nr:hypothetical protein [Thiococcus pfennigii]
MRWDAPLPPGPLWLWASPRSGALWPWSVALLGLRARVRPWLWSRRLERVRARVRRRVWWRAHPGLARAWRRARRPVRGLLGVLGWAALAGAGLALAMRAAPGG